MNMLEENKTANGVKKKTTLGYRISKILYKLTPPKIYKYL